MDDVLQHMDAVLPGHGTVQLYVPVFEYRPRQAVAISYTVHNSFLVLALLCSSDLLVQEFSSRTFALLQHLPHERSDCPLVV